jgi:glycerol-3-phosphate acyltransferase PlsY
MVPTADLVARRMGGRDLRAGGSGNPGAANALALLGRRAGTLVLAGDVGKSAVAGIMGRAIAGSTGAHLAGTASVVGHCWPVWNGFRGGKGVAAGVGQCLVTFPAYFPVDLAVAAITVSNRRWKRRALAATSVSSVCWVAGGVLWWRRGWRNGWGPRPTAALPMAAAASSLVILDRFRRATPPAPTGKDRMP